MKIFSKMYISVCLSHLFQTDLFVKSLIGFGFYGVWLATDAEYSDSEGNSLFKT